MFLNDTADPDDVVGLKQGEALCWRCHFNTILSKLT